MKNIPAIVSAMADKAAKQVFRSMCQNPCGERYLYFKPSKPGHNGELTACFSKPGEEWELADPQQIPGNLTVDQIRNRFIQVANKLPILDPGEQV